MAIKKYSENKFDNSKAFRVFPNNAKVTFTIKKVKEVKKPAIHFDPKTKKMVIRNDALVDHFRLVCEADLPDSSEYNNMWIYDMTQVINDTGKGAPSKLERFIGSMTGGYKMPEPLYENTERVKPFLEELVGKRIKVLFSYDGKKNKAEQITAVEEIQDLDSLLGVLDASIEMAKEAEEKKDLDFSDYPDVEKTPPLATSEKKQVEILTADSFTYDVSKIPADKREQAVRLLKSKAFAVSSTNPSHYTGEIDIKPLERFKVVHDEAEINFNNDDIPF